MGSDIPRISSVSRSGNGRHPQEGDEAGDIWYHGGMTQTVKKGDATYYRCEACGLLYAEKEMAERCEAWCTEHKSCNLDIIKYAVNGDR